MWLKWWRKRSPRSGLVQQFNRMQLASVTEKKFPPYLFYILITNLCSQHHLLPTDKKKISLIDEMRQLASLPDLGGNKVQLRLNTQLLN